MLNIDYPGGLEIDRAHQSLARCRPDGRPPRAILAWFLRFRDRERIVGVAQKLGKVNWDAVLTLQTAEGRREFTDPKKALDYIRSLPP
eukprot:superscaffoldBa00009790_g24313